VALPCSVHRSRAVAGDVRREQKRLLPRNPSLCNVPGYRVTDALIERVASGDRNAPVFIKHAAHVPPPREAVRELMPALFDLLADEPSAAVRAVLGHFCFVFIHPYLDGNGRMGRFLMNAMLASGGYPWTIIRVDWRDRYMAALDTASARGDIGPFAEFVAAAVQAEAPAARPAGP
jgi:Fic family protein